MECEEEEGTEYGAEQDQWAGRAGGQRATRVCVYSSSFSPVFGADLRVGADNVLDNETVKIDFKPLYTCIHIYDALDAREELQLSYQADRRVRLPSFLPPLSSLSSPLRSAVPFAD